MNPRLFKSSLLILIAIFFATSITSCGGGSSEKKNPFTQEQMEEIESLINIIYNYESGQKSFLAENLAVVSLKDTADPLSYKAQITFYNKAIQKELRLTNVYTFNVSKDYIRNVDKISSDVKDGDGWRPFDVFRDAF